MRSTAATASSSRRRAERRVGARLSRAPDVAGCVAIPSYSPADSESAGFLCIAAYVENSLFCRIGRAPDQADQASGSRAVVHSIDGLVARRRPSGQHTAQGLRSTSGSADGTTSRWVIEKDGENARRADLRGRRPRFQSDPGVHISKFGALKGLFAAECGRRSRVRSRHLPVHSDATAARPARLPRSSSFGP